jgi:DNA polymerase III epsilon subunit-like protein
MINTHYICCLDFETDDVNPYTAEPVQLACVIIHPRTLKVVEGSEFNSTMRPVDVDDETYVTNHKSTIDFHAKNQRSTAESVVASWKQAPSQKSVWENFVQYLGRYHTTQTKRGIYTAPLICGYNILGFDIHIINRLSTLYGNIGKDSRTNLFFGRDKIDLMLYSFQWFENLAEPSSYSLDTLREFFGINPDGAHDALKDVKDCADMFVRWQRLIRRTSERVKFKDSFKPEPIEVPGEINGEV